MAWDFYKYAEVLFYFPQTILERPEFKPFWWRILCVTVQFCCFHPSAAAAGTPGTEASTGAAGAPEEDGEPPHGAGAGEAAEGAETATAKEQGEGTRE